MSFRVSIALATLAALAFALLLGEMLSLARSSERGAQTNQVIAEAHAVEKQLLDLETGMRGYLLSGDNAFLQPYKQSRETLSARIETLAQLTEDSAAQQQRIGTLRHELESWLRYSESVIASRSAPGPQPAVFVDAQGKALMDEMRSELQEMLATEERLRDIRLVSERSRARSTAAVGAVAMLLWGVLVAVHLRQRKRWEDALAQNEERFRVLAEQVKEYAIFMLDKAGHVVTWNAGAERLKGYTASEILGRSFSVFYPPEAIEAGTPTRVLERAASLGQAEDEGWRVRKDGSRFWANVVITRLQDAAGNVTGFTKVLRELTEQKRRIQQQQFLADLGKALSESLDYESVFRSAAQLAVTHLADWCVVDLLDDAGEIGRAVAVHADPRKQPLMMEFQELYKRVPQSHRGVLHAIKTGRPILGKEQDLPPAWSGWSMAVQLGMRSYVVVPIQARGKVFGAFSLVSASRDFTAADVEFVEAMAGRVALAAENARLYREARRALRAREDTVAIVSHDLRAPLNAIRLNAKALLRLVQKLTGSSEETREKAEQMAIGVEKAALQGNQLITDLLDFAKLESGTFTLTKQRVDLRSIFLEVAETFRPLAQARHVGLEFPSLEGPFELNCEANRVAQVLSNLLSNAIKFTPEGGQVRVEAVHASGEVRISVQDTGPGIPEALRQHVFDRYWQPEGTRTQGAGLGLAIAKGIVEAHKGTIWLESTEGAGSTFTFTLPEGAETK